MEGRTAAYLKIQDGCDETCSFCVVRLVRGRSRSASHEYVLERIDRLVADGAKEIVLTGINIGAYGYDLHGASSLERVLEKASQREGVRFRLSSINPLEITDGLMELMAKRSDRICPHLHIPMQSGSDEILRKMERPYTAGQYRAKVMELADRVDGIALGCDVMAGFPGETEEDFRDTHRMLTELPFSYAHVFPYSPRERTKACLMEDAVPEPVKKERVELLKRTASEKNRRYRQRMAGKTLTVLVEDREAEGKRRLRGKSGNFLNVEFAGSGVPKGSLAAVRITGLTNRGLEGEQA